MENTVTCGEMESVVWPAHQLGEYLAPRQLYGFKLGLIEGGKVWLDLSVEDTFAVYDPEKSQVIASGPRSTLGAGFPRRPKEYLSTMRRSIVVLEFVQNTLHIIGLNCKKLFSLKLASRPARDSHALFVMPKTNELVLLYSSEGHINYVQISLQKMKVVRKACKLITDLTEPGQNGNQVGPNAPRHLLDSTSQLTLLTIDGPKITFHLKQIHTHLQTSSHLISLHLPTGLLTSLHSSTPSPTSPKLQSFQPSLSPSHLCSPSSLLSGSPVCQWLEPSLNLGTFFMSYTVPIRQNNATQGRFLSKFAAEDVRVWRLSNGEVSCVAAVSSRPLLSSTSDGLKPDLHGSEWSQKLVSSYTLVSKDANMLLFIKPIKPSKIERSKMISGVDQPTSETPWFEVISAKIITANSGNQILFAFRVQDYGLKANLPHAKDEPMSLSLLKQTEVSDLEIQEAIHKHVGSISTCEQMMFGISLSLLSKAHKGTQTTQMQETSDPSKEMLSDEDSDEIDLPHVSHMSRALLSNTAFQTYWGHSSINHPHRLGTSNFTLTHDTVYAYCPARGLAYLTFS